MLARLLFFWLKYVDTFVVARPAAIDAASGTFFLGRRRTAAVSDVEVLGVLPRRQRQRLERVPQACGRGGALNVSLLSG